MGSYLIAMKVMLFGFAFGFVRMAFLITRNSTITLSMERFLYVVNSALVSPVSMQKPLLCKEHIKKSIGCLLYVARELTECVWGDDSVNSLWLSSLLNLFLLPFIVSVARAQPPTQSSSHKEPADSGEWMET